MMTTPQQQEAFPQTRRTWMGKLLDEGDLATARRHIMGVYERPLRIYCQGCSLSWVGDPQDLVAGFFADRLSRPAFLQRWLESGRALRFWLIVGFKHYMLEEARRRNREHQQGFDVELDAEGSVPDREFDRACAVQLVHQALEKAAAECQSDGLGEHWDIFCLYHIRDTPLDRIAADKGVSAARAAVMKRSAVNRFRATLRELISWNGADDALIDAEIRDLRGGLK